MVKILIETIGNSIMVSLFAASLIEFFSTNAQYGADGFESTTGIVSFIFLIYLILFGLVRWVMSKRNKSYSLAEGEFSAADEREERNASFAATISYKALIISLLLSLAGLVFTEFARKPPFNESFDLFISGVTLITIVICVGFVSYGMAWIYKDTR